MRPAAALRSSPRRSRRSRRRPPRRRRRSARRSRRCSRRPSTRCRRSRRSAPRSGRFPESRRRLPARSSSRAPPPRKSRKTSSRPRATRSRSATDLVRRQPRRGRHQGRGRAGSRLRPLAVAGGRLAEAGGREVSRHHPRGVIDKSLEEKRSHSGASRGDEPGIRFLGVQLRTMFASSSAADDGVPAAFASRRRAVRMYSV